MKKNIIKYSMNGALWGNVFLVFNLIMMSDELTQIVLENLLLISFIYALTGAIMGLSTIIYLWNRFNLFLQSIIQFSICTVVYIIATFSLNSLDYSFNAGLLNILISFIPVYLIIWFGFYLHDKHEEKKINDVIKNINKKNHD